MNQQWGVDSEVGALTSVMLHRPGAELERLTPRNNDQLLFDALPWVARAQEEHDAFADVLRSRGVEVLLLSDLLTETLEVSGAARVQSISSAVDPRRLGHALAQELAGHLRTTPASELARILIAGMTFDELPAAGMGSAPSLVRMMHHGPDFVINHSPTCSSPGIRRSGWVRAWRSRHSRCPRVDGKPTSPTSSMHSIRSSSVCDARTNRTQLPSKVATCCFSHPA